MYLIKDITIQLLRNAVVHGIEAPSHRIASGKDAVGQLKLKLIESDGRGLLIVEDDGHGIDFEKLKEKAESMGYFANLPQAPSKKHLLQFMFSAGVSTKQGGHNEDAGRGVGTDVIKDRLKQLGGKIVVKSQFGHFTRFQINFPISIVR